MKLEADDSRLTAYVLGELSPEETAEMDYAVAADPALKLAIEQIESTRGELSECLGVEQERLLPRQRNAILREARNAAGQGRSKELKSQRQAWQLWTWPLAAAAVVIATMFIVTLLPAPKNHGSGEQVGTETDAVRLEEFVAITANDRERDRLQLPLVAGRKSLTEVTQSIRESAKLPSQSQVRIEELLQGFPLDAKSSVALWKGCSVGIEVMSCPWSPSGSLVFVKIRGSREGDRMISVEYQADPESVISSELFGYELEENQRTRKPLPQRMAAGSEIYIAMVVNSKNDQLGRLSWSVDGEPAPELDLVRNPESEASSDSRFAALICSFALWLRGEKPEMIDEELILGLAREVAAESLVADRYDFLELVDQAMKLGK